VLAFDTSEYRVRLDRLRAFMSDAELDALIVINEGNLCYVTGYEGFSDYVPQAALVTLEEDPYILLREMDVRCAERTCWLSQEHLFGYAENAIGTTAQSPWTAIGEFVKSKVPAGARIGAEFTSPQRGPELGVGDYARLVAALGVEQVHDASGLVSKCKVVKSDRELSYIAEAAAITDRAMLAGIEDIAVGARQSDVAATIIGALAAGTEDFPGGPGILGPFIDVGEVANAPHMKWAYDRYESGHQANLEFGAYRHRYCAPMARTVYLGSAPARLRAIDEAAREGWHAAFDAIRPGVACSDVARAFHSAFEKHGIRKESRIGYSVGVDWMDGGASLGTNDDTEIAKNMAFHLLIGIWEQDYGYDFSETVVVTDDGARTLATVPRQLFETT
jgi:ectoine hydrolase